MKIDGNALPIDLNSAGNTYFTYFDDERASNPLAGGWLGENSAPYNFSQLLPSPKCMAPLQWPLGMTGGGFPPYVSNILAVFGGIFNTPDKTIYTTFSVSRNGMSLCLLLIVMNRE